MILNLFSIASSPFDLCVPMNLHSPVSLIKNNFVLSISSADCPEKTFINRLKRPFVMAVLLSPVVFSCKA